jgi:putative transposase
MARPLRIQVADGWHHVTARGMDRKAVFRDDADRAHFLQLLEDMVGRYRVGLHAYVLMDNHYHLLIQTPQANGSAAMQWLNVSYSVWFNRRHRRCGPLFQGRFKSIPVEAEGTWALQASLYLHLNPVRVRRLALGKEQRRAEGRGVVAPGDEVVRARLQALRRHRWSSYGAYAGYRSKPGWLECEALWARSQRVGLDARGSYRQWIEEYLRQGIEESVTARLTAAVAIGSVTFLERLRRQVKGNGTEQPEVRRWRRLMPFARVVAAVEGVKGEDWRGFCDRRGDWGRDLALWLGRKHCGLTLRELGAAAHGMAYPAASKAIKRMAERLQQDRHLRALAQKAETIMSHVQT